MRSRRSPEGQLLVAPGPTADPTTAPLVLIIEAQRDGPRRRGLGPASSGAGNGSSRLLAIDPQDASARRSGFWLQKNWVVGSPGGAARRRHGAPLLRRCRGWRFSHGCARGWQPGRIRKALLLIKLLPLAYWKTGEPSTRATCSSLALADWFGLMGRAWRRSE